MILSVRFSYSIGQLGSFGIFRFLPRFISLNLSSLHASNEVGLEEIFERARQIMFIPSAIPSTYILFVVLKIIYINVVV